MRSLTPCLPGLMVWWLSSGLCHAADPAAGADVALPATGTLLIDKCQIKVVDRALLAAERDGVVAEVAVQDGDVVPADHLLLRLRDDAARTRLELARTRAENDINVRYSRKVADTAKANLDAGLDLEKQNAISTFQLRQRKLEYERGVLSIEQSAFELKLAGLDADHAEAELKGYHVAAPFGGTVLRVLKRRGESVTNGEPVAELVNTDRVHVEGYGPLGALWDVKKGACVHVQLDVPELERFGVNDEKFQGRLILVDAVVQPVTGLVRVVAEVPNRDNILRDGLRARMVIDRTQMVEPQPPPPVAGP